MNGENEMQISNMLNRCSLSKIADYIIGNGELLVESHETDLETEIHEIERYTTKILNEYFPDSKKQEEFFGEIAYRETRLENIYFQLGFIAAIRLFKDFDKKLK